MLTAFSILLTVPDISAFDSGITIVMYTVGSIFGTPGKIILAVLVCAFAFATVICWYYYGTEALSALVGVHKAIIFLPAFLAFVAYGVFSDTYSIVLIVDIFMTVLTTLTVMSLIKSSDRIVDLSERGGIIKRNYKRFGKSIKGIGSQQVRERRGKRASPRFHFPTFPR
jgi:AGCS family alanine or glycine:cation symporter